MQGKGEVGGEDWARVEGFSICRVRVEGLGIDRDSDEGSDFYRARVEGLGILLPCSDRLEYGLLLLSRQALGIAVGEGLSEGWERGGNRDCLRQEEGDPSPSPLYSSLHSPLHYPLLLPSLPPRHLLTPQLDLLASEALGMAPLNPKP